HLPHGGRVGDRFRRGVPGLGKGVGGLRRIGGRERRHRPVGLLLRSRPMARIAPVTRDAVPAKEQAAYDAFSANRGSEPKIGPYSIIAHMPEMAQRLEALRTYLRKEASVSQKLQELVMLTVAREMNCGFIWYAHAAPARQAGLRDDVVDNLRES